MRRSSFKSRNRDVVAVCSILANTPPLPPVAIYGEDFEKVESHTAWKVSTQNAPGVESSLIWSLSQTVNAAHEFRVCVRPVEEELKDKVLVWIRFK